MMGTPGKGDKVPFKANYFFNSTMMASFLPGIVSKKNKRTEKNMVMSVHNFFVYKHPCTIHDCS